MAQSAPALQENDEDIFFGSDSNIDTPNLGQRTHEQPLLRSGKIWKSGLKIDLDHNLGF